MSLPIVAIVGRPNVGKSSLLNCLVGRRIAIVDATPGVTRDRIGAPLPLGEGEQARYVELVDTGGMGVEDIDRLTDRIEAQIAFAIDSAAMVLFIVDAREGVQPLDRLVAERLRKQQKPVVLVANKVDDLAVPLETGELFSLGFGPPVQTSAKHSVGRRELLERIAQAVGEHAKAETKPVMQLAVVGKRNAGKSSFINALAGEQRVIVSETPGTTRDSVDVRVRLDGREFVVIDTAGVRKTRKLDGDIEYYSHHRAMRSIRRADVVAMLIDASVPVSQVDKALAGEIAEQLKPVVLVVNKWDLATGKADGEKYVEYLGKTFPELSFAPVSLTTATENLNVRETVRLAEELYTQSRTRVGTGELNAILAEIVALRGPSHPRGTKPPKILYASQIAVEPPTIVCFVNDVRSFQGNYVRFLLNQFRERLPFAEVPIRLIFRRRGKKSQEGNRQ